MLALLDFARAVRDGLSKPGQRELPSIYLYDEIGTALFEAITFLPEYGLTRADERLLRRHAPAILEHLPPPVVVAELGSGTGRKTRWLLETLARREPVNYYPIDISPSALAKCEQELAVLGAVSIVGLEKSYLDGLQHVAVQRRPGQTLLVLFLGSTVGNFDRAAAEQFLREVRRSLLPGDALLLGTDLEKPVADRCHRGVQPEPPGAHQPRARRRLRAAALRARGQVRRGGAPHRNAPALVTKTIRDDSRGRLHLHVGRRRDDLDGGLPQVPRRRDPRHGRAHGVRVRRAMGGRRVALR